MSNWTDAGKASLDRYFERLAPSLQASGADPAEVIEDLRRHLDSEIATENLVTVTAADVQRLLARIGAPPAEPSPILNAPLAPPDPAPPTPPPSKPGIWILLGGVLLPLITLAIELATRMCAGAFFDPAPTWGHALLIAITPLANALVWHATTQGRTNRLAALACVNGIAAGVALFYTILFLPLLLPGLLAIIVFGWGLLPWSPLLALVCTVVLRRHLQRLARPGHPLVPPLARFWPALLLGFLLVAALEVPGWITRVGLDLAVSEDPAPARQGIRLLRSLGSEHVLLRACYGRGFRAANLDLAGLLLTRGRNVPPETARTVYYRVTGRAFNSIPAPEVRTGRGEFAALDEWTWDDDQGGEQVGGRLRGLSLRSSRLDANLDADAAIGYCEWVMEFRNDAPTAREARTQILLPPGGVVSRLTLWVNGEEREAAFAGRSHVREAYQEVAIRQRRDPVLVTTAGPDRILVQCFPVPPNGGSMRIRIGMTSPLLVREAGEATFLWPRLQERNFSIPEEFRHTLWLEAAGSRILAAGQLNANNSTAQGELSERRFAAIGTAVRVARQPAIREAWTRDTRAPAPQVIRQHLVLTNTTPADRLVVVIDGSQALETDAGTIAATLATLPAALKVDLLFAGDDDPRALDSTAERRPSTPAEAAAQLSRCSFSGGRDNLPTLVQAWDLAATFPRSAVLWIHGPQPVLLSTVDALQQRYERRPDGPPIHCLQTRSGPNRLIENLDGIAGVQPVPRPGTLDADLRSLLDRLITSVPHFRVERRAEAIDALPDTPERRKASFQLARLWAKDEISRLMRHRQHNDALKLAGSYQLVTPWSGAVVLETLQQFAAAGLQPVDAATVPSIPEPSTIALAILGAAMLWVLHRDRRRRATPFRDADIPVGTRTVKRRS